MTRRTFFNRVSAAFLGVVAAVYAPSCLRALEPVEIRPVHWNFRELQPYQAEAIYGPDWRKPVPRPTMFPSTSI